MKTSRIKSWITVWSAVLTTMAVNGAPPADQAAKAALAKPDKTYTGTVVAVNPKDNVLNVKGFLFSHKQFNLGNNCTYTLVDQNPGALGDVRSGQRVTVSYQDVHGVPVADHVTQQPLRDKGMVKAVDPAVHTMTVHLGPLRDKTFQVPTGCQITLHGDKSGMVDDIHVGDHVTVTYEVPKGKATAREIAQTSATFTGNMTAIDLDQKIIKAQATFSTRKFNLANDCTIVMNGKPDGKLTDLRPGEKLTFNYENVDGVNVANRIAPAESQRSTVASTTPPPGDY